MAQMPQTVALLFHVKSMTLQRSGTAHSQTIAPHQISIHLGQPLLYLREAEEDSNVVWRQLSPHLGKDRVTLRDQSGRSCPRRQAGPAASFAARATPPPPRECIRNQLP